MEKNRVKINKVTVFGPPFNGESFEPTNVNFLFGKNGAGKSTISRAIRDAKDISWVYDPGHGTTVQVFNDEYIKRNIEGEMNGVFTISEPDIETEKDIKDTEREQDKVGNEITRIREILAKNVLDLTSAKDSTYESCWTVTRSLIKQLKHNPTAGRKEAFFNQVTSAEPVEHPMEEIQKLEELAYGESKKRVAPYEMFSFPILDTEILFTPIVSIGETQFSLFMKEMGQEASDWVYKGFKKFQPMSKGLCPYCQQELKQDTITAIEQAFDDSYAKAVEKLKKLKDVDFPRFKSDIQRMLERIEISDGFSFINLDMYNELTHHLQYCLDNMEKAIFEKEGALSKKIKPIGFGSAEMRIKGIIFEANKKIEEHNKLVENGNVKANYTNVVLEQCAFLCKEIIQKYKKDNEKLKTVKKDSETALQVAELLSDSLIEKLTRLRAKSTSTLPVINKINNLLAASGFNSFSIAPVGKRNYKLVRPDNSNAQFLSEGEKNFICFLYFYYSVYGVLDETLGLNDRVVVIDDPVSSMDSDSVFIIAELVREIVDAVINAFNPKKMQGLPTHIKQVFVLTHNSFFYNEVAPMYIDSYANVSYFEIQKEGTKSHIVPNIKVINAGALNEKKVNYLPDLGNYSSLWEIYNTSDNPRILMNTMRRILEEYFLHNLGYRPMDFKKQILDHIKDGSMDSNDKILIRALVNYVANDAISSINFSTYTSDIKKLKDIFAVIFSCFHQDQHYNMMINR